MAGLVGTVWYYLHGFDGMQPRYTNLFWHPTNRVVTVQS
ncbi:hypothetical protein RG47T_0182 [Mucilaginibacter polytrichastri]|uniref:Uncharacterized protein n=1 Tax=Mucilaginibacter polytrichastri TaxID=1302689 RepID=A0A1Q5ZSK3_9SPHI|nr:hypothetical protein RG47T_0182 [Mucilaginibacter polytrichastri]